VSGNHHGTPTCADSLPAPEPSTMPAMGWLEAVVTVVKGLAWPAVVLTLGLVLRGSIGDLIGRATDFTGPAGVSARFAAKAAAVERSSVTIGMAEQETEATKIATPLGSMTRTDLLAEAHDRPTSGIILAGTLLHHEAQRTFGYDIQSETLESFFRRLASQGLVPPMTPAVARRFERLYDDVADGGVLPPKQSAEDLADTAWRLAAAVRSAKRLSERGLRWSSPTDAPEVPLPS